MKMSVRSRSHILITVLGYVVAATAWIFFSDRLLGQIGDPALMVEFATYKGLFFVAVTGVLFFLTLRYLPREADEAQENDAGAPWGPLLAAAAAMVTIVAIAHVAYRAEATSLRKEALAKLEAMAGLEVESISRWLEERRANAMVLAGDPARREIMTRWREGGDEGDRLLLDEAMGAIRDRYGFAGVALVDHDGRLLVGEASARSDLPVFKAALERAVASGPAFLDLHRRTDGSLHMAFLAPMYGTGEASDRLLAVAVLDLQPEDHLFPKLASWPLPSSSGENVLNRLEDGYVVRLWGRGFTGRDFPDDRYALTNSDRPTARHELTGERGMRAIDGRGIPILAAVATEHLTGWRLVAKINEEEALGGLHHLATTTGVSILVAFGTCVGLALFLWQRQRIGAAMRHLAQQRRAQAAEDRYRVTFEEVGIGIAHVTLDGRWIRFNRAFCAIAGYSDETLRAISVADIFHPDDRAQVLASMRQLGSGEGDTLSSERRVLRAGGGTVLVSIKAKVVRDVADGTSYVVAVVEDVTVRRAVESELRRAAAVFTNTQEGVVITDPNGIIVDVNPAFDRITGWHRDEVCGRNIGFIKSGRHDKSFYHDLWVALERDGHWQGEIWNKRRDGELFPQLMSISSVYDEAGRVTHRLGTFIDIAHLKASEARLTHLAHYDSLTDLPNRVLFYDLLEHALEAASSRERGGAVLFLDLDRFKTINDSLGHACGDELLLLVSQRLRGYLPEGTVLARLGGDEFVGLVPEIADEYEATLLAQAWLEQLADGFMLSGGRELFLSASIGISFFPKDGLAAEDLLQAADAALYAAKGAGGATHRRFDPGMKVAASERLELDAGLRRALERSEFELHYQPLVRASDGRTTGVEALLRWRDPVLGLIGPDRFLPVAVETGLIIPIGEWVLRTACAQMRAWRDAGLTLETMAVNLSPREFLRGDLIERLSEVLAETGLPAVHLEIEITEGALMDQGREADRRLALLKALGVRLAVDDFGTGYSSLAYLRRMPIDKLKIDQSFVREMPGDGTSVEITATIVSLARTLGLEVLAEGVETEAQYATLLGLGCDTMQGYLFSRPLPAEEIPLFLLREVAATATAAQAPAPRQRRMRTRRA